jgi:hypothetical protein
LISREHSIHLKRAAPVLAVLLLLAAAGPVSAQPPVPIRVSTRSLAMGGTTLLSGTPIEMSYYNPGGITLNRGFHFEFIPFQYTANSDNKDRIDDFFGFIDDNETELANFSGLTLPEQATLVSDLLGENFVNQWTTVHYDPVIGVQFGSLAFSAYSVSRGNFLLTARDVGFGMEPVIALNTENDVVVSGGLGLQIGPLLHGGVGIHYLTRRSTVMDEVIRAEDLPDFTSSLDVARTMWGEADSTNSGFSLDVGGTLTLTKALAVGGVIRGLVSSFKDRDIEPEAIGGVRVKPLELMMGIPLIFIRDITLEANLRDVFNVRGEQYLDKLQLGAEVKIPLFALRAGYNDGKLSYGAGFRFLFVDAGLAVANIASPTPVDPDAEDQLFSIMVGIRF